MHMRTQAHLCAPHTLACVHRNGKQHTCCLLLAHGSTVSSTVNVSRLRWCAHRSNYEKRLGFVKSTGDGKVGNSNSSGKHCVVAWHCEQCTAYITNHHPVCKRCLPGFVARPSRWYAYQEQKDEERANGMLIMYQSKPCDLCNIKLTRRFPCVGPQLCVRID